MPSSKTIARASSVDPGLDFELLNRVNNPSRVFMAKIFSNQGVQIEIDAVHFRSRPAFIRV